MSPPPSDTSESHAAHGLLFDAFEVGRVFDSAGRTITEADIQAFAGLSGDFNPLHTDEEHARKTAYKGRIAHGLLVQSIASGLANQMGIFHRTITALAEMTIRYRAPVRPGDTIRVRLTVSDIDPEPSPKRGWVRFDVRVDNQKNDAVIEGEWLTIFSRRPPRNA